MNCPGGTHALASCCTCAVCGTRENLTRYKALTESEPLMFCPKDLSDEQANDVWLIQHGIVNWTSYDPSYQNGEGN